MKKFLEIFMVLCIVALICKACGIITDEDVASQSSYVASHETALKEAQEAIQGTFLGDYGSVLVIADTYTYYYPPEYPDESDKTYNGAYIYDGEEFTWQLTLLTPSVTSTITNVNDFNVDGGTVGGAEHFVRVSDDISALTKEQIVEMRE